MEIDVICREVTPPVEVLDYIEMQVRRLAATGGHRLTCQVILAQSGDAASCRVTVLSPDGIFDAVGAASGLDAACKRAFRRIYFERSRTARQYAAA